MKHSGNSTIIQICTFIPRPKFMAFPWCSSPMLLLYYIVACLLSLYVSIVTQASVNNKKLIDQTWKKRTLVLSSVSVCLLFSALVSYAASPYNAVISQDKQVVEPVIKEPGTKITIRESHFCVFVIFLLQQNFFGTYGGFSNLRLHHAEQSFPM